MPVLALWFMVCITLARSNDAGHVVLSGREGHGSLVRSNMIGIAGLASGPWRDASCALTDTEIHVPFAGADAARRTGESRLQRPAVSCR